MSTQTTLVVTAIPNSDEMEAVQAYIQGVMPLFLGVGGKLVKRLKIDQTISGKPSGMVLVMDFDTAETVTAVFVSEDYKKLIPTREKGFSEINIHLSHAM